jgi:hypothetical protein
MKEEFDLTAKRSVMGSLAEVLVYLLSFDSAVVALLCFREFVIFFFTDLSRFFAICVSVRLIQSSVAHQVVPRSRDRQASKARIELGKVERKSE